MSIQSSVNQSIATVMGGVLGVKHIGAQQEQLKQAEAAEMTKIENAMTEAVLTGETINGKEVTPKEAKEFNIQQTLGLKMSDPTYQARFDELMRIKSEKVLQSETYAKLQQDTLLRKRFSDLISTQEGRERLNETMSEPRKKEIR